jgi:hypothetical protein
MRPLSVWRLLSHWRSVAGRWKLNTRRAAASGSSPLVKNVSAPRALVAERQRPDRHHQPRQGFAGIGQRLRLHAAEGAAQLLGLHHPHQLAAQEQAVIRLTAAAGQFAHRHALGRCQVHGAAVLHRPAGLLQQGINALAGLGFGRGFRWQGGVGHR